MSIQWSLRPAIKRLAQIKDWLVFIFLDLRFQNKSPSFQTTAGAGPSSEAQSVYVWVCVYANCSHFVCVIGSISVSWVQHRGPVSKESGQQPHWAKAHRRSWMPPVKFSFHPLVPLLMKYLPVGKLSGSILCICFWTSLSFYIESADLFWFPWWIVTLNCWHLKHLTTNKHRLI